MQVTMTLEEYLELQRAKENLEMCINAANYCIKQDKYNGSNGFYLVKCIAAKNWNDIDYEFSNKPQI